MLWSKFNTWVTYITTEANLTVPSCLVPSFPVRYYRYHKLNPNWHGCITLALKPNDVGSKDNYKILRNHLHLRE